jgi:hypothetical protein
VTANRDRRPLAGFLGAVGVSALGTRMSMLALPWLVLTTTGSAALTGVVAFAEMAPYVTVQAIGGPMVDRLGARRISVATDLLAAAFLGLVPVLFAARLLPPPALAGLVAVVGGARGAGDCAREVMVPGVGGIARLPLERSTGLFDGVSRAAALVGLPLAGTLVAVSSPLSVLAIDAGTFAASAALVAAFVPQAAQPPRRGRPDAGISYRSSLAEGFRFLRGDRLLLAIVAMIMITNFIDQAGGAVLWPVWSRDVAHSPVVLGLLGGALGLGAVAGNALTTWAGPRLPRRMTYAVGFLLGGAPRYLALAVTGSVPLVLAVAGVSGVGLGGINPVVGAAEYERVPRHLQARVLGAVGASAWAGIPLGSLAGGVAVAVFGLRPALLAAGVLYGVVTLAPFTFPVWRQLDRRPSPPPGDAVTTPGPAGRAAADRA